MINALDYRKPDYPIEKLFVARWSPRAMTGEPLSEPEDHRVTPQDADGPIRGPSVVRRSAACLVPPG